MLEVKPLSKEAHKTELSKLPSKHRQFLGNYKCYIVISYRGLKIYKKKNNKKQKKKNNKKHTTKINNKNSL